MKLRKKMSEEELEEFLFRRLVLKVGAQVVKRGDCYFPLPSERASCCGRSNSLTHFYSFEHVTHLLSRFMRDADLKVNRFIVDLVYMKVYIHADR
ncbi:MAG: hypothetical protein NZ902_06620, partial [Acidilobaceae archaeon]|nr:hypothetical protein [Acidilobaceae archaeon]